MKKLLLALSLVFIACSAKAQPINPIPADSISSRMFINLGTPPPGVIFYCVDCQQTATCAGAGTGAYAFRTLASWSCLIGGSAGFPLLAPNGTLSAPSYSFASNPTAGIDLDAGFAATLKSTDGSGTDQLGGNSQILSGRGTGVGYGGSVAIAVALPNAASGTTLNSYSNIALFQSDTGKVLFGGMNMLSGTPGLSQFYGANAGTGRTDLAGGGIAFRGGQGTGTGAGGSLAFSVAPPAAGTATTQNAVQTALDLSGTNASFQLGNVTIANASTSSNVIGANSSGSNNAGGSLTVKGGSATAGVANGGDLTLGGGAGVGGGIAGQIFLTARAFASLGTPANGALAYCSDCTIANPCAGSGTGALAKRLNSVWVCN